MKKEVIDLPLATEGAQEMLQKLSEIEWDVFECKLAQDKSSEDVWETNKNKRYGQGKQIDTLSR